MKTVFFLFYLVILAFPLNSCVINGEKNLSSRSLSKNTELALTQTDEKRETQVLPKKMALVIGNGRYEYASLRNSLNDAEDVSLKLEEIGFHVRIGRDLDYSKMQEAIDSFIEDLRESPGSVGLFYYAGHGARANNGSNYLIPTNNNRIKSEDHLVYKAIDARDIMESMQELGKTQVSVLVLDACRDNPFRSSARSLNRGLNPMSSKGSIVIYAADEGKTASDGDEYSRNGLFSKHFIRMLDIAYKRNMRIHDMFMQVSHAVKQESNGQQEPWFTASLSSPYCFKGCGSQTYKPLSIHTNNGSIQRIDNNKGVITVITPP